MSRVEALSIILRLSNVDFKLKKDIILKDVNKNDWFYKYSNFAVTNKLIELQD
jgi:hypothetical protein